MKAFRAPDGTTWGAEVEMPSHSSAMVIFHHPTGETARLNRYAWVNAAGPKSSDPRSRLVPKGVLESLTDRDLARLFRRSMPIETERPVYIAS